MGFGGTGDYPNLFYFNTRVNIHSIDPHWNLTLEPANFAYEANQSRKGAKKVTQKPTVI